MAGWKTDDMLAGLEGVMNLAAAAGADLGTTSDIVTDALTAFGKTAGDSARLADIMAAASTNANTNVEMMGETFKYAAPIAGALHYEMEDVAVAVGLMANSGIKASSAGTSLRSIMTRLATDAGASSKQLGALGVLTEELGVQFYNADGSARELSAVLTDARAAWKGLGDEQQVAYAKTIAGQRGMAGWLAIMNAADTDVDKLTTAINNCNGAAQSMADRMNDNLVGKITLFNSALEGLGVALYGYFSGPLQSVVGLATKLINGITDSLTPQKTALETFIDDIDKANADVAKTLQTAKQTIKGGEDEAATIKAYGSILQNIMTDCEKFNQVTLDDGKTAIVKATQDAAKEGVEPLGGAFKELDGSISDFGKTGIKTSEIKSSVETITEDVGQITTAVTDAQSKADNFGGLNTAAITGTSAEAADAIGQIGAAADTASDALSSVGKDGLSTDAVTGDAADIEGALSSATGKAQEADAALSGVGRDGLNAAAIEGDATAIDAALSDTESKAAATGGALADVGKDGLETGTIKSDASDIEGALSGAETAATNADAAISTVGASGLDASSISGDAATIQKDLGDAETAAVDADGAISAVGASGLDTAKVPKDAETITGAFGGIKTAATGTEKVVAEFCKAKGIETAQIETGKIAIVGYFDEIGNKVNEVETKITGPGVFAVPMTGVANIGKTTSAIITYYDKVDQKVVSVKGGIDAIGKTFDTFGVISSMEEVDGYVGTIKETATDTSSYLSSDFASGGLNTDDIGRDAASAEKLIGNIESATASADSGLQSFASDGLGDMTALESDTQAAIGYVKSVYDETTGALKQVYVVQDEFSKAQVTAAIQGLSKYIPELTEAWNENTGELDLNSKALQAWTDQAQQAALQTAMTRALENVRTAYAEATVNVAKAQSAVNQAHKQESEQLAFLRGLYASLIDAQSGAELSTELLIRELDNAINTGVRLRKITVEQAQQYYQVSGAQASYTGELLRAEEKLEEAQRLQSAAKDEYESTTTALEELERDMSLYGDSVDSATGNVADLSISLWDLLAQEEETAEGTEDLADATTDLTDANLEAVKSFMDMSGKGIDAMKDLQKQLGLSDKDFAKWCEDTVTRCDEVVTGFNDLVDSITKSMGDFVSALDTSGEEGSNAMDNMVSNLQKKNADLQKWVSDMTELGKRAGKDFPQALYDELVSQGPGKMDEAVHELAEAAREGSAQFEEVAKQYEENLTIKASAETLAAYTSTGKQYAQYLSEGFIQASDEHAKAVETLVNAGILIADEATGQYQYIGSDAADSIIAGMSGHEQEVAKQAKDLVEAGQESASQAAEGYTEAGKEAGENVAEGTSSTVSAMETATTEVIQAGNDAAKFLLDSFRITGRLIPQRIASGIEDKKSSATDAAQKLAADVNSAVKDLPSELQAVGKDAAYKLSVGIANNIQYVTSQSQGMSNAAKNQVNTLPDAFRTAGANAASALAQGLSNSQSAATSAASQMATAVRAAVNGSVSRYADAGANMASALAQGIRNASGQASSAAADMAASARSAANAYVNRFADTGWNMASGLAQGIRNGQSLAVNAARDIAAAAVTAANTEAQVRSPSRKTMQTGRYMAEGIAVGILDNLRMVENAGKQAAQTALEAMDAGTVKADITADISAAGARQMSKIAKVKADTTDVAGAIRDLRSDLKALQDLTVTMASPQVTVMVGNQEFKGYIVRTAAEGFKKQQDSVLRGMGA